MKSPEYKKVSELTKEGYEYFEDSDGYKFWLLNGRLHREDGPAVEYSNGIKSWFLNDEQIFLEMKSDDPKVKKLQEYMKIQEILEK